MDRKERIVQQLGMPHGTATNKLRKNILFSLLVRLQENVCFKCGQQIFSVNELSIEHKQPWEGRDSNLFWDLNNIAFSHLRCNVAHVFHGRIEIKVPEGTIWCGACKSPKPASDFTSGAKNQCQSCKSILNARRIR